MTDSRERILNNIRRRLKRGPVAGEQRAELERRLADPPRQVVPKRALLPHAAQVELFIKMALEAFATVERVEDSRAIPAMVAAYLERENLPRDIVVAPAGELTTLPWETQLSLRIECRRARPGDKVSVTPVFAGIAETGTLLLLSGPETPSTLNFLPDVHIAVLPVSRIVGPYEDAWTLLRARGQGMPRTVNLITGPSRSGDIEQTLQLGAHGPVRLHIVLYW